MGKPGAELRERNEGIVSKRISQREARSNRKELARLRAEIQSQRRVYGQEYRGVHIASNTWNAQDMIPVAIRTARKIGHTVICVGDETGVIRFVALPHPKEAV